MKHLRTVMISCGRVIVERGILHNSECFFTKELPGNDMASPKRVSVWFGPVFLLFLGGCAHFPRASYESEIMKYKLVSVPLTSEHWNTQYTGHGAVEFASKTQKYLLISPKYPQNEQETYAALVTLKATEQRPVKDYVVEVEVTSQKQLRPENPNEWEVFWFFGNYRMGDNGKKEANYFLSKPRTGIELGRVYQEVGQDFLSTYSRPQLHLGERSRWTFYKRGQRFRVYKDRQLIMDYTGRTPRQELYDHPGTFGLYSEDALVLIHSFAYTPL